MIVRLFKNLSDTRWFSAIAILILLFVPFNYLFSLHDFSHTLLTSFPVSHWFNYQQTPVISFAIIILTITSAILLHYMLIINKLTPARNYTGLLFTIVLIIIWHPVLISFSDVFTLLLLLFGLFRLLSFEESSNPLLHIFDSAFLISIAGIINIFLIPLILLPFITLVHFRSFHVRLWLAAITGLLLPIMLLNTLEFFLNNQITFFTSVGNSIKLINIDITHLKASPYHWIVAGILIIPAIFRTLSQTREKKIAIRKKTILLIWFFLIVFGISFLNQAPIDIIIYLIAFPSGFFISSTQIFLYEKKIFALMIDIACIALIVYHSFYY